MPHINSKKRSRLALVLGRSGIVRSLGREGVPITLVREGEMVFERASRYCREFICLPNLVYEREQAVEVLEKYGSRQEEKPVAFFNGESDVMLFSENRERLGEYYEIMLSPHDLIDSLIDKSRFKELADRHNLAVPKTFIPDNREECLQAAAEIGYPCVLKPVKQRRWHMPEILDAIGLHKGILVKSEDKLKRLLDKLPPIEGGEMVQEHVPGGDDRIYEFHAYIDRKGTPLGAVLGQKIRTYPIHFGQSAYARVVDEPEVTRLCLDTLARIGYNGAADVDVKRHSETGQDYIFEINPRFSIWTAIATGAGVNLPLLQYKEALGEPLNPIPASGKAQRWLWFGTDRKAMMDYWRKGESNPWQWFKSFFAYKGPVEFHVFAWDDPAPLMAYFWFSLRRFFRRGWGFIIRRLRPAGN